MGRRGSLAWQDPALEKKTKLLKARLQSFSQILFSWLATNCIPYEPLITTIIYHEFLSLELPNLCRIGIEIEEFLAHRAASLRQERAALCHSAEESVDAKLLICGCLDARLPRKAQMQRRMCRWQHCSFCLQMLPGSAIVSRFTYIKMFPV